MGACRAKSFERAQREVEALGKEGFPALQVLAQLQEHVMADASLPDLAKANIFMHIAAACA